MGPVPPGAVGHVCVTVGSPCELQQGLGKAFGGPRSSEGERLMSPGQALGLDEAGGPSPLPPPPGWAPSLWCRFQPEGQS